MADWQSWSLERCN